MQEYFRVAQDTKCDLGVFTGNLLSGTNPNFNTIYRATSEIRRGVVSSSFHPHPQMKILSGPFVPNTEKDDLGVKFPIFSNHGQADKPTMIQKIKRYLEPQESLVSAGLINRFSSHLVNLKVSPFILEKGKTTVALYGIPYMTKFEMRKFLKNRKKEDGKYEWLRL